MMHCTHCRRFGEEEDYVVLRAQGVQVVQYGVLAVCLAGDKLFQTLGVPTPALYMQHVAPNRFGTAMGAWLVGNMAQSSLTQTGAFEIYANGEHIFSKLHAQRMPSSEELRKGLQGAGLTHITQLQASRGAAGQQQGALGLATLLDTLDSFPGVSHIIYSYLRRDDRRACRLVCTRLRTVIDDNITHVTIHLRQAVEDTMERIALSSLRPTILSLMGTYDTYGAEVANELSSALSAPYVHKLLAAPLSLTRASI
ncbi:hypothetical protein QJQ45_007496 [Haematococcus lacustris]|nr:hypothetical protein QJQ45_007496 [Haematococcus lacustris]